VGNLVDTYVITQKKEWVEVMSGPDKEEKDKIINAIPADYQSMLKALLTHFDMDTIMRNSHQVLVAQLTPVQELARKFEEEDIDVTFDIPRRWCLKKILRTTFYDTLMVAVNDNNENKTDYYHIISNMHDMDVMYPTTCGNNKRLIFFGLV